MRGQKIVVTGGSGFIGSHLVHRLLEEGANTAVVVRYGNVVKNERLRDCWDDLHVIEADLRNRGALDAVRQFDPDVVFHLAAYNHVGQSFTQVEECFDVNAKGTANILDICSNARRFVYLSTSEVYGYQTAVPFVETMSPEPISPYAITKYAGELYCRMQQRINNGPSIAILRSFNVFGPYQSSKAVIPELIIRCLRGDVILSTEGIQTREFNYVGNLVDALLIAGQSDNRIDGVVNIASGREIAIRDLVMEIAHLTDTKSEIRIGALPNRPTEIWRMFADASRAQQLLGWRPSISLEAGLQLTIDWFRDYLSLSNESSGIASHRLAYRTFEYRHS